MNATKYTASEAIKLAIEDHKAANKVGPDFNFVSALREAEQIVSEHAALVAVAEAAQYLVTVNGDNVIHGRSNLNKAVAALAAVRAGSEVGK